MPPTPPPSPRRRLSKADRLRQLIGVSWDLVRDEGELELFDDGEHFCLPCFSAEPTQPNFSEDFFDSIDARIRQISELERENIAVPDQGGAEAGSETEKKHSPSGIAPECLHGSVIDDANGFA